VNIEISGNISTESSLLAVMAQVQQRLAFVVVALATESNACRIECL
jgi:hypothetical protein